MENVHKQKHDAFLQRQTAPSSTISYGPVRRIAHVADLAPKNEP